MLDYGENIHPEFTRQLSRTERESLLKQRAGVIWLYGLSGSGKSTLVNALDRRLYREGFLSVILDGDNLRSGLNNNLGFSDQDRHENIRELLKPPSYSYRKSLLFRRPPQVPRIRSQDDRCYHC